MSASLKTRIGGLAVASGVQAWMGTLDYQAAMYDPTVDPVNETFKGPLIAIFWHEYLLAPFYLRGRSRTAILTSRHRDAEWLSEAARHLGFDTIRGSSYRGGTSALLAYIRDRGTRNLGVACDGPRGPRRRLAQGPIYLSSKLQIPLVAYGIGYDRPWRMPTWDRFAVPRPYSAARIIKSPRIQIPGRLRRKDVQVYQQQVEDLLLRLTFEAEAWAESGTRKVDQRPIRREPAAKMKSQATSTTARRPCTRAAA